MKVVFLALVSVLAVGVTGVFSSAFAQAKAKDVIGAWQTGTTGTRSTMICSEKHFAVAIYDAANKRFIGTYGGSYSVHGDSYSAKVEFHTLSPEAVGSDVSGSLKMRDGMLILQADGGYDE